MPSARLEPLRTQFGGSLPDALDLLSDDELADLGAALADAEREQAGELDRAIDHTLRFLPWPLNGIVRKILLG